MTSLLVESWLWYSVVIFLALSRFISRRMTLGDVRRYQADDYAMLVVLCFYTTLIATINIVYNTSSNLLPPGFDLATLTPQDIADRQYGSKLILVVEQSQCATIWGAKVCLLILYHRLTSLRWENIGIKLLAGYVVLGFVVMEILYFGVWCRPFHNYWAVPTPNVQCDAATNHLITNATLNLSSDIIMIAIALPMFLRMKLPWQKKVPLVLVFSLGIFVVLAAVLNKVYSFTEPFGSLWCYWYVRESSTALLVANLPFVWGLFRRVTGMKSIAGASRWHPETAESSAHNGSSRKDSSIDFADFLAECRGSPVEMKAGSGGASRPCRRPSDRTGEPNIMATIDWPGEPTMPKPPLQRAITIDVPLRDTLRRDFDPERRAGPTPSPSKVSSLEGSWSAVSFV